ncbi:MAG TPA: patatin-like phospholipase family protein [Ilumatobacter sp.]|jgi:predicted acylesterase/phospholipase RssA|nr:patatin-like phospholipase family protein [Ilumatobacter sp.]
MTDALLLNAGASWAAYQVGAIEHLMGERRMRFDCFVGCGIGAMHAALLACGAHDRIGEFWNSISTLKLVRPNLRTPWRAPMVGTPQRRFVAEHVSEAALTANRATLAVTTFDLMTGDEVVHRYPGDPLPIVDAVMTAVATPGLIAPRRSGDRLLAEATLIDSVPLAAISSHDPPDRVVGVLAGIPLANEGAPRRYRTWRAVADRAFEINLAHDSRRAIERSTDASRWSADATAVAADLADIAGEDRELTARFKEAIGPLDMPAPPQFVWISPSKRLGYPLWRFPTKSMHEARRLGHDDAARAEL